MRILFIGPGYPGATGTSHGAGIGTYMRELTLGLTAQGHECHVLVWATVDGHPGTIEGPELLDGVSVFVIARSYWPLLERIWPDSRDVYNLRRAARKLDAAHPYDWIEIENEEGIDVGVQREFPSRTILRVHTTTLQMAETKQVRQRWGNRYRLGREQRSFQMARRTITHLDRHADELRRLYPDMVPPHVVPHGIDVPAADSPRTPVSEPTSPARAPRILIVGTPDPRKGFDRIRPILTAYSEKFGACVCVVVSACTDGQRERFRLMPPYPAGVEMEWKGTLDIERMWAEYAAADVLLFPSRYESFGFPLVEAAACGLPVVTSDVGVAGEMMRDGLAEYVVDADDPLACARAIRRAINNRALVGDLLQTRFRESYTRKRMVGRYLEVLAELG